MWQEFSLEQQLCINDTLVLSVSLSCTSLCDVVECVFLSLNHFGKFKTRSESFLHFSIVRTVEADAVEDIFVTEAVKSTEKNDQWNWLFNQIKSGADSLIISLRT